MSPYQIPTTPHDLRQKLFLSIDKLSDRSTFTQASNELNYVAKSLPSDLITTFLSCILTVDSSLKSPVRVHCLNLVSILARIQSSSILSPHLTKILNSILRRLREHDSAVRAACAGAVSALSPHNPAMVIDTLTNCVSTEQELGAQTGGCLCLKAAIDTTVVDYGGVDELMRKVLTKILKLLKTEGFKAKAGLLGVMASLISVNGGNVINVNNGGGFMRSVVEVAIEMLSSEDWGARKGGAEVLQMVSEFGNVEFVGEFKRFVVGSLESRRFDKVKVTRETMNRAWEAWKEIPGDPDEVSSLPRSNSSVSKGYGTGGGGSSPPLPRRSSFAGSEAYSKPKKTMNKSRSSVSDVPTASISSHEMPQRKQTLSKSRSSMSDDSSITDSSSISKSSCDFGFETPQSKKQMSKNYYRRSRKSLDWKVEVAVPSASSTKFESEDETELQDKTTEVTTSSSERGSNFFRSSEERIQKTSLRNRAQVNPVVEEDEKVGESTVESAELSLIRTQLSQIERQQSDLLELVQRFMGKSQNGIDSLKTRVSGLERALDEISHDLAVQTGRIPNNGSSASTCCPSTEFLSPKFWRRTEGKSSNSRPSYSGNGPNKDTNLEAHQMDGYRLPEQNDGKYKDSWGSVEVNSTKSVKVINQNTQKGRTCSPRSFDAASTTAFKTSVVKGA